MNLQVSILNLHDRELSWTQNLVKLFLNNLNFISMVKIIKIDRSVLKNQTLVAGPVNSRLLNDALRVLARAILNICWVIHLFKIHIHLMLIKHNISSRWQKIQFINFNDIDKRIIFDVVLGDTLIFHVYDPINYLKSFSIMYSLLSRDLLIQLENTVRVNFVSLDCIWFEPIFLKVGLHVVVHLTELFILGLLIDIDIKESKLLHLFLNFAILVKHDLPFDEQA